MKLLSFRIGERHSYGALKDDAIIDLGRQTPYASLRAALAAGALDQLREMSRSAKADLALADVVLLTPVPDAEKIVCIGVNYRKHVLEVGRAMPAQPSVFFRLHSSFVPSDAPIMRPNMSSEYDYEGELALVIGKAGRGIPHDAALDHVAGYTIVNDGSIRDFQMKGSLAIGKNFAASGSIGPWIVTADEIPDPRKLVLETRLNGERVQHTGLDDLIFDIPAIIAYVSAVFPLEAGDIIATGTPDGVALGQPNPRWLRPGDRLEVEVSGIGILRNGVVQAPL